MAVSNYKYIFSIISCTSITTISRNSFPSWCFMLLLYIPCCYAMFWSFSVCNVSQYVIVFTEVGVSLCLYLFRVLLNRAPSSNHLHPPPPTSNRLISTSTQLHPPPPSSFQLPSSSLQHPQQYLNQIIARNWAISPNLG